LRPAIRAVQLSWLHITSQPSTDQTQTQIQQRALYAQLDRDKFV